MYKTTFLEGYSLFRIILVACFSAENYSWVDIF